MRSIACAVAFRQATMDGMSYGVPPRATVVMPPIEAERRGADRRARHDCRDHAESPFTPGVISGFGVFIALVGSALLYVLTAMEKGDDDLRAFLVVVQFAAWPTGSAFGMLAGLATANIGVILVANLRDRCWRQAGRASLSHPRPTDPLAARA